MVYFLQGSQRAVGLPSPRLLFVLVRSPRIAKQIICYTVKVLDSLMLLNILDDSFQTFCYIYISFTSIPELSTYLNKRFLKPSIYLKLVSVVDKNEMSSENELHLQQ